MLSYPLALLTHRKGKWITCKFEACRECFKNMKFKVTKFTLKDIDSNNSQYIFDTNNKKYPQIIINTAVSDETKSNKRKIYDIISIDGFPDAQYCSWTFGKDMELEIK